MPASINIFITGWSSYWLLMRSQRGSLGYTHPRVQDRVELQPCGIVTQKLKEKKRLIIFDRYLMSEISLYCIY